MSFLEITELNLSVRTFNCLVKRKITTIEKLKNTSINELLLIKNLGRKSLEEIKEKMLELGVVLPISKS